MRITQWQFENTDQLNIHVEPNDNVTVRKLDDSYSIRIESGNKHNSKLTRIFLTPEQFKYILQQEKARFPLCPLCNQK